MLRWIVPSIAVLATLVAAAADAAGPPARTKYPPRYRIGTNFPTITQKRPDGTVATRRVYPGYKNGFPTPAWLYYGYPHSGDGLVSPGW